MSTKINPSVLVICDSNFVNLCDNPEDYLTRLCIQLKKRIGDSVIIKTVTGRFGLTKLGNNDLELLDVEDRNKTVFIQTLENQAGFFDELQICSNHEKDPFIQGASSSMSDLHKTITRYGYPRKSNDGKS